jgi:hypothetical protein
MAFITTADLEQLALDGVKEWLLKRIETLHAEGRQLHGLIAFGPLVQHASAEELDLLEVVDPLPQVTTRDITNEIPLDRRFFGRVALISISPADLDRALAATAPLLHQIFAGFKVPYDTAHLSRRLTAARKSLKSA